MSKRWFNIVEAGEYIGYSRYKIYKLIKNGLPVSRVENGNIRIDRDDLDQLMLNNKVDPHKISRRIRDTI